MNMSEKLAAGVAFALISTLPAHGDISFGEDGVTGDFGKLQLRGRFSASAQFGAFEPVQDPMAGTQTDAEIDGSARLSLEYTADNAWVFGAVADIDSGQEQIEGFERDEFYLYAASEFGRVEIGENDGPADTLSFHAPRVGLGQVRGDFARYTGTVALLSPFDSQDAAKVTYLSPPIEGLRFGIAYAPEFEINADDPIPTRRTIQEDVIEFGAQYVQPFGDVVVGVSSAYIQGTSDPITGREDIESWSVGLELRRGNLTAGAAFVDRGRSNLFATSEEESEWNAGLAWNADGWAVAGSLAIGDEIGGTVSRYGVGGTYDITANVYAAADLVLFEEENALGVTRDGTIGLFEIGVRF